MKRLFLTFAVTLLAAAVLRAVPAKSGVNRTLTLADGSKVVVTLCGDEYAHWWEASDGTAYTVSGETAMPISSDKLARMKGEGLQRKAARNAGRQARLAARRNAARANAIAGGTEPQTPLRAAYSGTQRGLVILVNFADKTMTSGTAKDDFNRMFNEEGYSENNHIGSVADYFRDQSYGAFDIAFDVAGPVTVEREYAYYGQNDSYGDDRYPCTMVAEACRLVNDDFDFSAYDWDGDGEVEQVFIVYAGYGENSGAPANTIWPHEWTLSSGKYYGDGEGPITLDGVKIDTYAVTCELSGTSGTTLAGIGVACHEFSHSLGFPDFYDTSYSGGWGMQAWDLLDSGSYNGPRNNGEAPSGYTAYERWQAGWLEPTMLVDGTTVEAMQPLGTAAEAYILYNDNDENEFYLLENRQSDRWFGYVGSYAAPSGLLVVHVDYDADLWYANEPNNEADHQRMTIIQANNEKGSYRSGYYSITRNQYSGHVYPYNDNDSLTAGSTPAATLYNANAEGEFYMSEGIYDIARNADGTMSFSCRAEGKEGDETNGISDISATGSKAARRIFGLSGNCVGADLSPLPAGVYIIDDKKVVKR